MKITLAVEKLIRKVRVKVRAGQPVNSAARLVLANQPKNVLLDLAEMALVRLNNDRMRAEVLRVERAACRPGNTMEDNQETDELLQGLASDISAIIRRFADSMNQRYTPELMASTFALPDGTIVTWNDATVEQHILRAKQFQHASVANAEGAGRHWRTVDDIQAVQANTCGEMLAILNRPEDPPEPAGQPC